MEICIDQYGNQQKVFSVTNDNFPNLIHPVLYLLICIIDNVKFHIISDYIVGKSITTMLNITKIRKEIKTTSNAWTINLCNSQNV